MHYFKEALYTIPCMEDILKHFKKHDPVMHRVLIKMGIQPLPVRTERSLFQEIAENIIGQQLSGKAADTITKRFRLLVGAEQISPHHVLAVTDQQLRDQGLSWAKAKYIRDLATKVHDQELVLEELPDLEDEEIIARLTTVKGIGRWTAEMLLMFTLGRSDVFSHGDLGLKKGLMKLYGLPDKPSTDQINQIVSAWQPYRTFGSRGLWWSVDNDL
jgi:DNA-3-methyladenine glycosylase II